LQHMPCVGMGQVLFCSVFEKTALGRNPAVVLDRDRAMVQIV